MTSAQSRSFWSPLQGTLFRSLWIASFVSNVGSWMQDVGAGWLMTSLSPSPSMVALVEAADSFPLMLLALPAGALADIVDRRRLLAIIQVYLFVVGAALGILTWQHITSAWVLIGFTLALGVGAAMMLPAWSAIIPDLVSTEEMPSAIAINSLAINASRAAGPALAGFLVAAVGPWLVFVLNAVSNIGILVVLLRWRHEHRKSTLPAERLVGAMRVGMRFVLHTRALQFVLIRGAAFFIFASATWSLFPLVVRQGLGRGPEVYGLLLTCIGVGAVAGAMLLPSVRAQVSRDTLVAGASALYAAATLALAYLHNLALLGVAMLATGMAWISILSALQVAAQMTLPAWVRARGLASFVVVFMGGMAIGSVLWGQIATRFGIPQALTMAALGTLLFIGLTWRFKLGEHRRLDFTPTLTWPAPLVAEDPEPDSGPVMVTIEYRVQPTKRVEFVAAMQGVREMRRRNGAYYWELFHDSADPTLFVECFMDESWIEHLRQHERASVADREIRQRAKQFMIPGTSTQSRHLLADRES